MVVVPRAGAAPNEREDVARSRDALSEGPSAPAHQSAGPAAQAPVPYPLASRALHPEKTTIRVGEALIGGATPVIIAGPCSIEDEGQIVAAAHAARAAGAQILRGGA